MQQAWREIIDLYAIATACYPIIDMDLLTIITILIIISAVFSYLNERIIKLPGAIGLVTISIVVSTLILIIGKNNTGLTNSAEEFAQSIDFSKVLLNIMLGFLMFAGAFQFDCKKLKEQRLPVFLFSTLSVMISTGIFGGGGCFTWLPLFSISICL
jgi:monovalent cation:H+ antiporter, CPA1 family